MFGNIKIAKVIFYTLTGLLPFGLWLLGRGQQLDFSSLYIGLSTIAKIAGVVGICFFAGNLILSGRYHALDRLFGGLDQLYLFHRKNGIRTFTILSAHVLIVTGLPALISYDFFIAALFDFSDWTLNFGRIAYVGLLVLVVASIYLSGKMKYERLKRIHQFMGVFLFIGGIHAYLIPSDIATNLYLRYYTLGLVGVATASYLWRTVLRQWLLRRTICDVVAVTPLSEQITEVVIKPRDNEKIKFYPGQFIFVKFRQAGFPYEDHPFSLTASTEEGTLRISAKKLGDFTKRLPELKAGAVAEFQGPFGGFTYLRSTAKKQVWVAGGIGVTPFMSMARTLRDTAAQSLNQKYQITMYHSVQSADELVFKKELEDIAAKNPNFKFIPWVAGDRGYLSVEAIKKQEGLSEKEVFICGPKPMLLSLRKQFKLAGVPTDNIHFELFKLL